MSVRVTGLSKSYGGVTVLDAADLDVEDGEIHALLGANGAGKSTLIKCLSGAIRPDGGSIAIDGAPFDGFTPKEAARAGVAVIYQEPSVVGSLSVAENVFLGGELRAGPLVRRRAQRAEAARWLAELGVALDPDTQLARVGNAEVQVTEIIRSLRRRPRLLILDEPTAALSEHEAAMLGRHLLELKRQRMPVLYVTHRLGEVFELADRVTVLRDGRVILHAGVGDVSREELLNAIAGRSLGRAAASGRAVGAPGGEAPLMELRKLVSAGIGPLDLELRSGEIVGVFGLLGAGRTELLELLAGARRRHGGSTLLDGRPYAPGSPAAAIAAGVALVPSDRLRHGLLAGMSALDNALLPRLSAISRFGLRRRGAERRTFDGLARRLALRPLRADLDGRRFSGGNQQKLVVGRWLTGHGVCRVMLLDEPTQGVDVGARSELYDALRTFAGQGNAVLLASSEPDELAQLCGRVIVLSKGRVVGELRGEQIEEHALLDLAHTDG